MPGGVSHGLGSTESHAQLRSEQRKYSLVATGERPDQRADLRYFGRDAINGVLQIHANLHFVCLGRRLYDTGKVLP
jgi:hypothetical protein